MQREIKFRAIAYDYIWVYGLITHIREEIIDILRVDQGWYMSGEKGEPLAYKIQPITIGQFTGLLDCNGKEIYEGDLVSDLWERSKKHRINEVKIIDAITCNPFKYFSCVNEQFEIIGNIYEHPQLLEG
jgi:hypothetical protein